MKHSYKNVNKSLPNMSNTIKGWFLNIELLPVIRQLVGSDWVDIEQKPIKTKGVVRPPSDEDLKILPDGTWQWEWLQIHCLPNVDLPLNQFVIYNDVKYKVMYKKDYTPYGYIRYTILEAFKAESLG